MQAGRLRYMRLHSRGRLCYIWVENGPAGLSTAHSTGGGAGPTPFVGSMGSGFWCVVVGFLMAHRKKEKRQDAASTLGDR